MWSRFFVHLTAAVCLWTAAVMERASSLTAAGFTSTDHHVRQFLLHQAWLPAQNKNSRMCQLKLPFSLLLSNQRCVLPQRQPWFIHLFTFQGNTWNQSERIKNNILNFRDGKTHFDSSVMVSAETLSSFIIYLYFIFRIKLFCYSLSHSSSDDTDVWSNF